MQKNAFLRYNTYFIEHKTLVYIFIEKTRIRQKKKKFNFVFPWKFLIFLFLLFSFYDRKNEEFKWNANINKKSYFAIYFLQKKSSILVTNQNFMNSYLLFLFIQNVWKQNK